MTPRFLTLNEVLQLHSIAIDRHGGSAELLDRELLESAVATPAQTMGGRLLHATIPDAAAAYLFHLTQNHPFEDGNKRVGLLACVVFLDLNGWALEMEHKALEACVWSVASGEMSKQELSRLIREHAREQR